MRTNCPNIMGELELIGKVSAFTSRANLGGHPARCKLCGPKQQSRAAANCVLEGQCELIAQILWANSSSSVRSVHSHRGPTSAAIPLGANYAGPSNSLVRQPIVCLRANAN